VPAAAADATPAPAAARAPAPAPVPAVVAAERGPSGGGNGGSHGRGSGSGGANGGGDRVTRVGRRAGLIALVLLVAGGVAAGAVILLSGSSSDDKTSNASASPKGGGAGGEPVSGNLGPVPTNHVNGLGKVAVRLKGNVANVTVTTNGLLDGAPHPLHIHAGGQGVCPPGTAAKRHNGHLAISTLDGVPWYGPPVEALTTRGDTSKESILALRRFPTQGGIKYTRKIKLDGVVASYIRNNNAVVIVHGADWNHNGVYDNSLDRSDLKRSLPGELTTPALCGPLVAAKQPRGSGSGTKTASGAGGPTTYYASLTDAAPGGGDQPAWLCPLHTQAPGDLTPA
jgi:hypothetical protein